MPHPSNAPKPKSVRDAGKATLPLQLSQPEKAKFPISRSCSGKANAVSLDEFSNADAPMYVRWESSAKATSARPSLLLNAFSPICNTEAGITTREMPDASSMRPSNAPSAMAATVFSAPSSAIFSGMVSVPSVGCPSYPVIRASSSEIFSVSRRKSCGAGDGSGSGWRRVTSTITTRSTAMTTTPRAIRKSFVLGFISLIPIPIPRRSQTYGLRKTYPKISPNLLCRAAFFVLRGQQTQTDAADIEPSPCGRQREGFGLTKERAKAQNHPGGAHCKPCNYKICMRRNLTLSQEVRKYSIPPRSHFKGKNPLPCR